VSKTPTNAPDYWMQARAEESDAYRPPPPVFFGGPPPFFFGGFLHTPNHQSVAPLRKFGAKIKGCLMTCIAWSRPKGCEFQCGGPIAQVIVEPVGRVAQIIGWSSVDVRDDPVGAGPDLGGGYLSARSSRPAKALAYWRK